ncbi:signal peptidase II [Gallaecimonas xiamenensis]|uniref:Lipoprotein signal peptidase n=1 Tax=Gallaecimonas xiamenensis 3-C-1 TaxID=745411 RepID=K2J0F1_9GAMM|nr:signal peptidase II [Gallaecimonas xiamenensis]EKE68272.1 lipoprotein signal peptidase [Gallaecimonas xiamenensis 3-C-1]
MMSSGLRWLWLTVVVIAVDLATKYAVLGAFRLYDSKVITGFFNLTYVRNYGAAFSFLSDAGGWQRWFFTILAVVVCAALLVWMRRLPATDKLQGGGSALIIGGALGNLYDRMMHGYVVDFLDFHLGQWSWPAFNVADSAICVGALMLVLASFRSEDKAK